MLSCIWPMDWVPVLHIPFLFWILINVLFFWSENSNIIFNDTYNLWKLLLSWLQELHFIWLLLYFFFQVSPVMYSFCEGLVNWCLKAPGNELLASLATVYCNFPSNIHQKCRVCFLNVLFTAFDWLLSQHNYLWILLIKNPCGEIMSMGLDKLGNWR